MISFTSSGVRTAANRTQSLKWVAGGSSWAKVMFESLAAMGGFWKGTGLGGLGPLSKRECNAATRAGERGRANRVLWMASCSAATRIDVTCRFGLLYVCTCTVRAGWV